MEGNRDRFLFYMYFVGLRKIILILHRFYITQRVILHTIDRMNLETGVIYNFTCCLTGRLSGGIYDNQ